MRTRLRPIAALVLAVPALPAEAVQTAPTEVRIPFEAYELANGLTVILAPDSLATAVAVNLWYDVGSRHEVPGRSGFAHLFEHLMFQGSSSLEAGEHARQVERAGGTLNASVSDDRTNYLQTLPPERLNLALWLEADRMRGLRITEATLRREIEVVKEERRLRFENAPYGMSQLAAYYEAPYDPERCFAYAHAVIGSPEDLDAASLDDVEAFFRRFYAPNHATLVVAGAFEPEVARGLVDRHFGPIPRGVDPIPVSCEDPFAHLPVDRSVPDPHAVLPAIFLSWGTVDAAHPDAPALEVLAEILGGGESARLHRRLVREEGAALSVGAFSNVRRGPGLFQALAVANQGVETSELLTLLDAEIARMTEAGPDPAELERARNRIRAAVVLGLQTAMGRAEALQAAHHFLGSPSAAEEEVLRITRVSADDVRRVAATYLRPENRAIVRTVPTPDAEARP